ncbi:hypothetical protein SPRG_16505 [Saprolegnia parasitica CBS 223.65]|uniref:Ankyrin repeat protein n=1 Tax=Saprolegnia parasitica (strain CBS 223.65) TaxID=695850 RepID=A0A067BMY6_SAPPC|nr:hypothetical protein SPRG_16505 [Saprolegnia parasitica CBS 223.65]KDO18110.1 hypothetical protein SPRG_16505 [Saprolegnia parasitica CBS 223.65]|eukprot:XP_012211181.1 hypothetical protein SPRG_16505 [Saprolegnia parasitica CBS 223.65]
MAWTSTRGLWLHEKLPIFATMFQHPPTSAVPSSVHEWFDANRLGAPDAARLVTQLLQQPSFAPEAMDSRIFRWACLHGHFAAVAELVRDKRVDVTAHDFFGVRMALKRNRGIVDLLCAQYPSVADRISDLVQETFTHACHYGHLDAVQYMLDDPRLLPATMHDAIAAMTFVDTYCGFSMMTWHSQHHMTFESTLSVVDVVRKHPAFDIGDRDGRLFRWFCQIGYLEAVEELLKHPLVDPSAKSSAALMLARYDEPMTALLLADGRVDPVAAASLAMFFE